MADKFVEGALYFRFGFWPNSFWAKSHQYTGIIKTRFCTLMYGTLCKLIPSPAEIPSPQYPLPLIGTKLLQNVQLPLQTLKFHWKIQETSSDKTPNYMGIKYKLGTKEEECSMGIYYSNQKQE